MILSGITYQEFPPPPMRESPNGSNYTGDIFDNELNWIANVTVIKNMTKNMLRSESISSSSNEIN